MKPITKVIDNVLHEDDFKKLENLIFMQGSIIKWTWVPDIEGTYHKLKDSNKNPNLFMMVHKFYDMHDGGYMSDPDIIDFIHIITNKIHLCLEKHNIKVRDVIRIKANLYPNTSRLEEHRMHIDYDQSNQAGLFSLNTCDGYTKLNNGTKVESVANRLFLFDGTQEHCSTTTTDTSARFNINFNWSI